jgi:hypothetical protein
VTRNCRWRLAEGFERERAFLTCGITPMNGRDLLSAAWAAIRRSAALKWGRWCRFRTGLPDHDQADGAVETQAVRGEHRYDGRRPKSLQLQSGKYRFEPEPA